MNLNFNSHTYTIDSVTPVDITNCPYSDEAKQQMIKENPQKYYVKEESSMISTTGKFSEFTDYQNVVSAYFRCFENADWINEMISNGEYADGMTFQEIYDSGKLENNKDLKKLIDKGGMGNFKVLEVVNESNGYDAVVLEDEEGNIIIYNFPTYANVKEDASDVYYDFYKIFEYLMVQGEYYDLEDNLEELEQVASKYGIDNFDIDVFKDTYYSQIESNHDLCNKYILEIIDRNYIYNSTTTYSKDLKQLHFAGWSLGGGAAEESYLYCNEKFNNFKEARPNAPDMLGTTVVYNPFHAVLSDSEIETLVQSGDLKVYCAEGDMVSAIFDQEKFDDCTKYIYIDTESVVAHEKEVIDQKGNTISEYMSSIVTVMDLLGADTENLEESLESFNYIELMFHKGTHSIAPSLAKKDVTYNPDGSLRDTIILENGEVYNVDGMTHEEASQLIYGFDMKDRLQTFVDEAGTILDGDIAQPTIEAFDSFADKEYGDTIIYGGKAIAEFGYEQAPGFNSFGDGVESVIMYAGGGIIEGGTWLAGQAYNVGEAIYDTGCEVVDYVADHPWAPWNW